MASSITLSDFECVYKTYYIRLYHYAYNFVNDADVSNDIVSEVFYKSWKNYRHIDKDKMPSFLYVCVRNECMNHLRKKRGMNKYIVYCKAAFSEEDDNYWQTMEERINEISNVIDEMPCKTRFVIEQCYLEHHSYKEVAEMLDISTNGVKKHIMKALSLLRNHFDIKK